MQNRTIIHCKNMQCWLHKLTIPQQYVIQDDWIPKSDIQGKHSGIIGMMLQPSEEPQKRNTEEPQKNTEQLE
jgi:hypothetical protein